MQKGALSRRYEHWLPTARPSPWPAAVVCVTTEVSWASSDAGGRSENASLVRWSVVLVLPTERGYSVVRRATGSTAESFWQVLAEAARHARGVWVLSARFREVAAALNLWQRMESGHVQISGRDHRTASEASPVRTMRPDSAGVLAGESAEVGGDTSARQLPRPLAKAGRSNAAGGRRQRSARAGICVLEDPPIIIELALPDCPNPVTWVDAANYGVEIAGSSGATADTAGQLAMFFIDAAAALKSLGRCGWQTTAASQAMHLFRSVFHGTPILCHTERAALSMERDSLFGGRCECFRIGKLPGRWHLYDFKGFYPYLYSTVPVPVRLVRISAGLPVASLDWCPATEYVIATVDIDTDEPRYPYRHGNAVIYPTGRFTTTIGGTELRTAIQAGAVHRVHRAAYYEAEVALARYADALSSIRSHADSLSNGPMEEWAKRVANCLHGKFAQSQRTWVDMPTADPLYEWGEWYRRTAAGELQRWRSLANHVQREERGTWSEHAAPAISAAICSAGRSRLAEAITTAGREHLAYCDTDSLIVDTDGANSLRETGLVRAGERGYLQHKCSGDTAEVWGIKYYAIGGENRQAGRPDSGGSGGNAPGTVSRQLGAREMIRRGHAPAGVRVSYRYERGPGRYDQPRPAGGRVRPIEVDEWE